MFMALMDWFIVFFTYECRIHDYFSTDLHVNFYGLEQKLLVPDKTLVNPKIIQNIHKIPNRNDTTLNENTRIDAADFLSIRDVNY